MTEAELARKMRRFRTFVHANMRSFHRHSREFSAYMAPMRWRQAFWKRK